MMPKTEYKYARKYNKLNVKLISLAVSMAMLSGCQSIWPDYLRPKVAVPAEYSEPTTQAIGNADNDVSSAQISNTWWTMYQDQILNDLVTKARLNNTDIKLAVARIEEADAVLREVGGYLLPQIDVDAAGARTRITEAGPFPPFGINPRNNYRAQLSTNFELDFWGKLSLAKDSARAQALSSRYAKDTVALSLSGLVTSNYLVLRSLDTQVLITRYNLKSREESLALTKRRLEGGIASALDVHQAEVASANLNAQLADLNRLRALSLHQLAILAGDLSLHLAIPDLASPDLESPDLTNPASTDLDKTSADIATLPIPPTPPAGLPSSLLEARPDVRQAEALLMAADANIGVAKAALYPTISLTASLGGESLELGDILKSAARIWSGGLSLNLPIFDGGRLNSRVEQASARQKQALANYEAAVQTAFTEVNDALVNLRQNTEREAALSVSAASAKKVLEISDNRYKSGYSAYLDVLDAQRVFNDAELAFIQSRQARLVATVDLFKALGGGWTPALTNASK